jgi:hypothetical protein
MAWRVVSELLLLLLISVNVSAVYNVTGLATSSAAKFELSVPIAVVSMVKNEGDILGLWLEYHSALFGISNIIILDNFSTDTKTHAILEQYKRRGLQVRYKQGPYIDMGDLAYRALKETFPDYKLALPLDVDEFLIAYRNGSPVPHKLLILVQLEHMWQLGGPCFGFKQYYTSLPTSRNDTVETVRYFTRNTFTVRHAKKIFWLQNITHIAFGAHQGTLHEGEHEKMKCQSAMDKLGLLHYHLRSPRVTAERALRDCIALQYLPRSANLDNIKSYIPQLQSMVTQHAAEAHMYNIAFHKIEEILRYATLGDDAFVYQKSAALEEVGTLAEIIRAVKSS